MNTPKKRLIEPRFKESIDRYIETGCPVGSFLQAVLENNLKEATGRADHTALDNIPHIVAYLYNDCPSKCWGSVAAYETWTTKKVLAGTDN